MTTTLVYRAPTYSFTWNIGSYSLSDAPASFAQGGWGEYESSDGSQPTYSTDLFYAAYDAAATPPPSTTPITDYAVVNPYIEESFPSTGLSAYNDIFMFPRVHTGADGFTYPGAFGCNGAGGTGNGYNIGTDGKVYEVVGNSGSLTSFSEMGSHIVDVKPYTHAVVAREAYAGSYGAVDNVGVTIKIVRSDGSIYTLLDKGTPWTNGSGVSMSTPAVAVQVSSRPNYSGYDSPPNEYGSGLAGGTYGNAAQTPAFEYDPYFGRTPASDKDIDHIEFTLTFPSGKIWTATLDPTLPLYAANSTTTQVYNAPGRLAISSSEAGIRVSLSLTGINPFGYTVGTTQPDVDLDALWSNFKDPSNNYFAGEAYIDEFLPGDDNVIDPPDSHGISYNRHEYIRSWSVHNIVGMAFAFVLDSSYDTSLPTSAKTPGGIACDSKRGWLHVATANSVKTFHAIDGTVAFTGPALALDQITQLAWHSRQAAIYILGASGSNQSLNVSYDGGQSIEEVGSVAAANSVISIDSKRNWIVWLLEDADHNVTCAVSRDGGATFDAAFTPQYEGADLVASLIGTGFDERRAALDLVCSISNADTIIESKDAGKTWALVATD